jgi:hypothetical protein
VPYPPAAAAALVLTESQLAALEKAKADKEGHGEFDTACPGYCAAQDTFYVGTLNRCAGVVPAAMTNRSSSSQDGSNTDNLAVSRCSVPECDGAKSSSLA